MLDAANVHRGHRTSHLLAPDVAHLSLVDEVLDYGVIVTEFFPFRLLLPSR